MARVLPGENVWKNMREENRAGKKAEQEALRCLQTLSDEYFVLCEPRCVAWDPRNGLSGYEHQPDFVVVGPELGVVVIEVKDWDIKRNNFQFLDQWNVRKVDKRNCETIIRNPWDQARRYYLDFMEIVKGLSPKVWVSYAVFYPRMVRAEFQNAFVNPQADNPQSRMVIDLERTLFQDDMVGAQMTLASLKRIAGLRNAGAERSVYTAQQVVTAVERIMPGEMKVGAREESEAEKHFAHLDIKQQEWALSVLFADKVYMADVAGSGKTNVLLSRALHLAKSHFGETGYRILITTYNRALKVELERILNEKIIYDNLAMQCYRGENRSLFIYDIVELMEHVVRDVMREDFQAWRADALKGRTEAEYIERVLPAECLQILKGQAEAYRRFDFLMVDEIQDFNTQMLLVAKKFLRNEKNLFLVGDVGQKLFARNIEWGYVEVEKTRAALHKRFMMYRSPKLVAKTAWRFLTKDPLIVQELQQEQYDMAIKPKSPFQNEPELTPFANEEALLDRLIEDIQQYHTLYLSRRMLCIGLREGLLPKVYDLLRQQGIPVRWATEDARGLGDYVILADYMEAKGLEREYVFIVDTERLAQSQSPFEDMDAIWQRVSKDRKKLFIALTRAIKEVKLYYTDYNHPFIQDLLTIIRNIDR
ncbi:nuclease-related domain-containing DEAD/DEAH box helicase [Thermosporothrix hazakensis]|nr:UvrD-helicase domain-containing protein [Thermosporothrix hazakensis]BBH91643.1 DNA helicase [Thermosporothrix sp. COM3]GCE49787.1 DNA helicase [Thermosporothrix hazakensis]